MKFSAQTELNGVTVFDPTILIEPEKVEESADGKLLLQPEKARAIASIKGTSHFLDDFDNFSSCSHNTVVYLRLIVSAGL